MKKTVIVASLLLGLLSGCIRQSIFSAKSDYDYSQLDALKHCQTFTFAVNAYPKYKNPHDDLIENEITHQMKLRGFSPGDVEQKAQLVVSYRVFQESITLIGYNQPALTYRKLEATTLGDTLYHPLEYRLRKGGMLIQLADKINGQTIWRGYISGPAYEQFLDERLLRREVRSIFDQFGACANGFLVVK